MVWKWLFGDDDDSELECEDGKWVAKNPQTGETKELDKDDQERAFKHVHNEGVADSQNWNRPNPDNVDNHDWWTT